MTTELIPDNAQHKGMRSNQEDAFYYSDHQDRKLVENAGLLIVLADGMGGLAHGEKASQTACRVMRSTYESKYAEESIPDALNRSIVAANTGVLAVGKAAGTEGQIGSTLVGAVIYRNALHWVAVGDSRLYLYRNGFLNQVNIEHVYARTLNRQHTNNGASSSPRQADAEEGALTSYLGIPSIDEMDRSIHPLQLNKGDRILLCSDGLSDSLSDEEIRQIITEGKPGEVAQALVDQALAKRLPNQDNITVALLHYHPFTAQKIATATTSEPLHGEPVMSTENSSSSGWLRPLGAFVGLFLLGCLAGLLMFGDRDKLSSFIPGLSSDSLRQHVPEGFEEPVPSSEAANQDTVQEEPTTATVDGSEKGVPVETPLDESVGVDIAEPSANSSEVAPPDQSEQAPPPPAEDETLPPSEDSVLQRIIPKLEGSPLDSILTDSTNADSTKKTRRRPLGW